MEQEQPRQNKKPRSPHFVTTVLLLRQSTAFKDSAGAERRQAVAFSATQIERKR